MKRAISCVVGLHRASFSVFSDHWHCERCLWMRDLTGRWVPPDPAVYREAAMKSIAAAPPEEREAILAALRNGSKQAGGE